MLFYLLNLVLLIHWICGVCWGRNSKEGPRYPCLWFFSDLITLEHSNELVVIGGYH